MYSVSTLSSLKYAINHILMKKGHEFDITKSPNFKLCMDTFEDTVKELKEHSKEHVNSAAEITKEGE